MKKIDALPTLGQDTIQEDESGLTLSIETPDDVAPKQKLSALDTAKALVRGMTHSDENEEEEAPAKKTRARKAKSNASKFFQKKSGLIASGLIWLLVTMVPDMGQTFTINGEVRQLAPTDEQAKDIVTPLLSILDRHFPVGELSPDTVDIGDFIAASVSYFFEMRATMIMLEAVKEHEKKEHEPKNQTPFPFRAFE